MIVAVIGATGVVGQNLLPRLLESGHSVRAGVRRPGTALKLAEVEEVGVDILDQRSVAKLVAGSNVAINIASSIPRADGGRGDWKAYDQIRREGTKNLIAACADVGIGLVAQSIAMLHCTDQSIPQNEQSPMMATGVREAALDLEKIISAWDGNWRIVRGGNLYGPGTSTDDDWFNRLRQGRFGLPNDGLDWLSSVHVADLAAAFLTVLEKAPPRTSWIAADDEPMRWLDVFKIVAELAGRPLEVAKTGEDAVIPGFQVAADALKGLGWAPRYASLRSGLIATASRKSS
jgi:nucleoside-diphosphate-sugar epimerase